MAVLVADRSAPAGACDRDLVGLAIVAMRERATRERRTAEDLRSAATVTDDGELVASLTRARHLALDRAATWEQAVALAEAASAGG